MDDDEVPFSLTIDTNPSHTSPQHSSATPPSLPHSPASSSKPRSSTNSSLPSPPSSPTSILIERNVALTEIKNLREMLQQREQTVQQYKEELGKQADLLLLMTESFKDKQNELQRALEGASEFRERNSVLEENIRLLREQLEEHLEMDRFASSDDDSVHGADEKVSAENALLKKQLEKKEEEIMGLRDKLEKTETSLGVATGRYMMNSQSHEPTVLETQLVETKLALAQARTSRDTIAMKYRSLESSYVSLKLELADTKSREDDQVYLNGVLRSASARLEKEKQSMESKILKQKSLKLKEKEVGKGEGKVRWQRALKKLLSVRREEDEKPGGDEKKIETVSEEVRIEASTQQPPPPNKE
ncbi:hypothetical protein TrVE_jg2501 [Triparma verrucosa]|uniref:Uncharacterized protein n=1 Tax=Triparma verrucosa TaxID=1606542 RepID=A0A9W7EYR8_9STRA|nr:hypothetical protein TrVE_jg2501 [Triparma verrucosa]